MGKPVATPAVGMKNYVHMAVTLAFMFLFRFLPAPEPLTPYGMAILGIFIGMIYGWTTSQRGLSWISFLALVALGLTDYGTCGKALANLFASETAGLLMLSMFLVGPVMECEAGEYLIIKLLSSKLCYQKPWLFTTLIIVGMGLLAFLVSSFIIGIFMLALFADLFKKAGYVRGDKYPTMLIVGMFISMLLMGCMLPWNGWGLYCTAAFANSSGGYMIDYGKYLIVAVVFFLVVSFGYVLLMRLMGCNVQPLREMDLSPYVDKYAAQGLNKHQKAVLISVLVMAIGCIFVAFGNGIPVIGAVLAKIGVHGVMLIAIACMLFIHIDGEPIADIRVCAKHMQWDMLLVIASALCLANVLTTEETGISALMAQYVAPLLMGKSEFVFMMILAVICLLLTNVSNNTAVMFVFMAVAGSFYANGIIENAAATLMIITFTTILGFYTPAASAFGAMIHGSECVTSGAVYKYGFIAIVFLILMIAVVLIPLCTVLF